MGFLKKINYEKFIKILSLTAIFAVSLFLVLLFYSAAKDPGDYFLPPEKLIPKKNASSLKMLFLGDLMLDRHVGEKISQKGLSYLFENLDENFFCGYDIVSANLEGAVTDEGAHYNPVMSYDFAFSPKIISELKKYHFNFFNLANNHFSDQGERGIMETRKNLDNLNFYYSGCPDGQIGDCSGKILEVSGKKIGLAGFSSVYSLVDQGGAGEIIKDLAGKTDLVIVNVHWGEEYKHQFNKIQQKTARNLIDAGADIIIGHHPHVVQGIEIYRGKPIFYSLGNFIFDQYFSSGTQEGLAIGVKITEEKNEFYLFPLKSKLSRPEPMEGQEKEKFFSDLVGWSNLEESREEQVKKGNLVITK
ncbi:MAG: CapA family protein [Patescibacteria group bacterium]|nr:CapA family protein [Patescibacteria group bacterium]